MLTRVIGFVACFYFGLFGFATWHFIATQPHTWKNYMAAAICTIMSMLGLYLFIIGEPKNDAAS